MARSTHGRPQPPGSRKPTGAAARYPRIARTETSAIGHTDMKAIELDPGERLTDVTMLTRKGVAAARASSTAAAATSSSQRAHRGRRGPRGTVERTFDRVELAGLSCACRKSRSRPRSTRPASPLPSPRVEKAARPDPRLPPARGPAVSVHHASRWHHPRS